MDKERKMMILCLLLAGFCSPVSSEDVWTASVVKNLEALVGSCVVMPCTYSHPREKLPTSRLRGIWHRSDKRDDKIYFDDQTQVLENFRGRTKLLGELGQNNCTLEMTEVKNHDNGPFCFRIELARTETEKTKDMFSFVENCVELTMISAPPEPTLEHLPTATEGHPYIITCSVIHTCPTHPATLTWSRTDEVFEVHKEVHRGNWEKRSTLTFIPGEEDDHKEITCTATFHGPKSSSKTLKVFVKRAVNYNHIIIPTVVGLVIAATFTIFCVLMVKKYNKRISELQNQDGSMFNRLSRLSRRIRSSGPGPSHSDHRRSIWSRFSRRPKGDTVDFGHTRNNMTSQSYADQKVSKPRFPSPKSKQKSCNYKEDLDYGDDYENTADLNVYGNI